MKKLNKLQIATVAVIFLTVATSANADLITMISGTKNLLISAMSMLNIAAGIVGAYFVFNGVMSWKKSSNEQGGGQIGFKEIIVPIIAGVCLLGFSFFIMMTSQTFGLSSTTSGYLG